MAIRKAFVAWFREEALWDALVMACCGAGMAVGYAHEFKSVPLYLTGVVAWFTAYHFLNQMKRKSDRRIAELEAESAENAKKLGYLIDKFSRRRDIQRRNFQNDHRDVSRWTAARMAKKERWGNQ